MLKATLAEFIDNSRVAAQYIALDLLQADTTIGRLAATPGSNHYHVGGRPEFAGISRIQATILVPSLEVIDGSPAKKSECGILIHGKRVDRVPLKSGTEIDIFKNGTSHVLLYVTEELEGDSQNPTMRQEDLIVGVREDVADLKNDVLSVHESMSRFNAQISQILIDLADRQKADARQDRQINQLAVGALGAIAALCMVFWGSERVKIDPLITVSVISALGATGVKVLDKKL